MKKITNERYDISDGEIGRVIRFTFLNKIIPLGYFAGGATVRILFILLTFHRLGRPVFRLIMPQEARLTRLYRKIRKPITE